jgi:hypothetical protein
MIYLSLNKNLNPVRDDLMVARGLAAKLHNPGLIEIPETSPVGTPLPEAHQLKFKLVASRKHIVPD